MIKSMTGYGKSVRESGGRRICVEIRSLNSKQADISLRLPAIYRDKEYEIRNTVTRALRRGKIDVSISYEQLAEKCEAPVNAEVFKSYHARISAIASECGIDLAREPVVGTILRLPEVIKTEREDITDDEWAELMCGVEEALAAMDTFRIDEGAALWSDLLARIEKIEQLKATVEPYEKGRAEVVRNRIKDHVSKLLQGPIDENRLEQEMIFYIEKFDITEEKTRLDNHCRYFRQIAADEEDAGRKLGFVAQEIGREINTLGSKANDAGIQRIVVDMKDELEKIKEQLFNIL